MSLIQQFLGANRFAVAGASADPDKYGNKVFRALLQSGRQVFPLNPIAKEILGHAVYATLADLPEVPESLSVITPPHITRQVVAQAIAAGVKNIWMQPGAEEHQASQAARKAGINVIDDGSCILVLWATERSNRNLEP